MPEQVDVALDGRLDLGQLDAAGRGDVRQAGGQAGGDRVQQELHRCRAVVAADQHGRVVGVDEGLGAVLLLAGAVEALDRASGCGCR